jgi:NHLM bacteriocin system ABC transporter ATP-binding protein
MPLAHITQFVGQEESEGQRLVERVEADTVMLDRALRQLSRVPMRESEPAMMTGEHGTLAVAIEEDIAVFPRKVSQVSFGSRAKSPDALENETYRRSAMLAACHAVASQSGITVIADSDINNAGSLAEQIEGIASSSSIRIRRVALRGEWWTTEAGPLVGSREATSAPVALLPNQSGKYQLYDPADGTLSQVDERVAASLDSFAYTFYRPFPPKPLKAVDLLSLTYEVCKKELITLVLLGIAVGSVSLIIPIVTGVLFDVVIPNADRILLWEIFAFLAVAAVSSALFSVARGLAMLRLETRSRCVIEAAVWDRLLSLPVSFFRQYNSGDLAQRSMGISQVQQALMGSTTVSLVSAFSSLLSVILLLHYSVRLGCVAIGMAALAFVFSTTCGYLQLQHERDISRIRGRLSGIVLQMINGIAKLKISGAEIRAFSVWARIFAAQKRLALKPRQISNIQEVFSSSYPILCLAGIFVLGSQSLKYHLSNALTPGHFAAFMVAFSQFIGATLSLTSAGISILQTVPAYERAKPILNALPEVNGSRSHPGTLSGAIEFSRVTFRYRADTPPVLHNISFSIIPGEFVAVVGPSGSGKSTLIRLLLGFEAPEAGSISYDNRGLAGLDVNAVRRQLGVVLQNSSLLRGDILTNIISSSSLGLGEAWEAARLAGIAQDIQRMPMGMNTVIGDGGIGLSGGQRQRLMIARAIIAKPAILLFDEATSSLDNRTQSLVMRNLKALRATRIVVAHRLSTIINADRLLVFHGGDLVQQGTYAELINRPGVFRRLAHGQIV